MNIDGKLIFSFFANVIFSLRNHNGIIRVYSGTCFINDLNNLVFNTVVISPVNAKRLSVYPFLVYNLFVFIKYTRQILFNITNN